MVKAAKFNKEIFEKENLAVFFALVFVGGFLGARAVLSIATLLLGLNGLRGHPWRLWYRNPMWLGALLWWGLYVVSFFWSQNAEEWGERVQVKFPFLLMPLAVVATHRFKQRQWNVLVAGVLALMLCGVGYSVSFLLREPGDLLERYGRSYVFRTPAYNDHISFSAAVAITIVFVIASWKILYPTLRKIAVVMLLLLAAYLHLLAAKTGLVILYGFALLLLFRLLVQRRFARFALLAALLTTGVVIAWQAFPTLRNRVGYIRYGMAQYRSGQAAGNYSDPSRLYSYVVATKLIAEKPFGGYGAGTVVSAMDSGYNRWNPHVAPENRLVPHNQFLASGVAAGVFSVLGLGMWWLSYPVWVRRRGKALFYPLSFWLLQSLLLFVDPTFEVQMGVALFLFFQYWFSHLPENTGP